MITEEIKVGETSPTMSEADHKQMFERLLAHLKAAGERAKERADEFKRRRTAPPEERTHFWEQPRSAELDRVGDWILANHVAMREESIDRGSPL